MAVNETSDAIRNAIKAARPRKVEEIARSAGMDYHRLANIQYGKAVASQAEIDALRKTLNLSANWPKSVSMGSLVSLSGVPLVSIPVVGNTSAGIGIHNVDSEMDTVEVPDSIALKDAIGYIVDGDSMMPLLEEGDTTVYKKATRRISGFVYLVKVPDDGFYVKLLAFDRGEWFLISLNDTYEPIVMKPGTEVLGVLIGIYRVRGTEEIWRLNVEGIRPSFI